MLSPEDPASSLPSRARPRKWFEEGAQARLEVSAGWLSLQILTGCCHSRSGSG
jgi:hypothetical protein